MGERVCKHGRYIEAVKRNGDTGTVVRVEEWRN